MSERKTRILHAITRLDKGGSANNTILSAIGLLEMGYEVDILFGNTEDPTLELLSRARRIGVEFIEEDDLVRNIRPIKDIVAFWEIWRFIRDGNYDVVHAHSSKAGLICRLAAKLAGVKVIVYTPHGHVFYGYFSALFTRIIIFLERMCTRVTDKLIALTPAERDEWLAQGIGREDQYVVVHSGLEFDEIDKAIENGDDWRRELKIPEDHIVIGSTGRFIEIKGYDYLLDAAIEQVRKRGDVHFLLAGDGPLRDKYRRKVLDSGCSDRIHIMGWQQNIGAVVNSMDIFVLPSLNEGMGRVLIEAMYLKKPVIATRVGGVPSVVTPDMGMLVEPADPSAISSAIDTMLMAPGKLRAMGEKGHERATGEYSSDLMVRKLDALYRELLGNE